MIELFGAGHAGTVALRFGLHEGGPSLFAQLLEDIGRDVFVARRDVDVAVRLFIVRPVKHDVAVGQKIFAIDSGARRIRVQMNAGGTHQVAKTASLTLAV